MRITERIMVQLLLHWGRDGRIREKERKKERKKEERKRKKNRHTDVKRVATERRFFLFFFLFLLYLLLLLLLFLLLHLSLMSCRRFVVAVCFFCR